MKEKWDRPMGRRQQQRMREKHNNQTQQT